MFGDDDPGAARHESGGRGDVYGAFGVSARAASIYHAFGRIDLLGEAAHGAGEADDLGHCFALHTQRGQERGGDGGWSATLHDGLQGALGLALGEGLPVRCFP